MENNMDQLLTRLMDNLTETMNNTNNNPQDPRESPSVGYLLNRQLEIISNFSILYNYNHIEYQRTSNQMLSLLLSNMQTIRQRVNISDNVQGRSYINTTRPTHNTRRNTHRPQQSYNNIWNNNLQNTDNQWNGFRNSNNIWHAELQNVLRTYLNQTNEPERRLTTDEITINTRTFTFTETNSNELRDTQCAISLEAFVEGDILCEINSCRHVFRRDNLLRWLRRSNCCPVCRYNMLTQSNGPPTAPPSANVNNNLNNTNNNNNNLNNTNNNNLNNTNNNNLNNTNNNNLNNTNNNNLNNTNNNNNNNTDNNNNNNTFTNNDVNVPNSYVYTFSTSIPVDNSYNYIPTIDLSNLSFLDNPPVD
jgi:hypothetical protein